MPLANCYYGTKESHEGSINKLLLNIKVRERTTYFGFDFVYKSVPMKRK